MTRIAFLIVAGIVASFLCSFETFDSPVHAPQQMDLSWAEEKNIDQEEVNKPDIEWFKKEMKISPQYLEKKEGILGMSWPHFITMVFLIIFSIGALIDLYLRNRRTRQILANLMKEEKNGSKD